MSSPSERDDLLRPGIAFYAGEDVNPLQSLLMTVVRLRGVYMAALTEQV